jgi:TonB family protein
MRYVKTTVIMVIACLGTLSTFSACYRNNESARNAPAPVKKPLGKLVKFIAPVIVRRNEELAWSDASSNLPLFAYDAIQTRQKAQARIVLINSSELHMEPDSLVILDPSALGGSYDRAVVREGTVNGETKDELWIMTSAALIQMKSKGHGQKARVQLTIQDGETQVELKEGSGKIFRAKADRKNAKPGAADYEEVVLTPKTKITLSTPHTNVKWDPKDQNWDAIVPQLRAKAAAEKPEPQKPKVRAKAPASTHARQASSAPAPVVVHSVARGLSTKDLQGVAHEHGAEIHYCFDSAQVHNLDAGGRATIRLVINSSGKVKSAHMEKGTSDSRLDECILNRIATWDFPKTGLDKDLEVTYPFVFQSLQ